MAFKLPKFQNSIKLVKPDLTPSIVFHQWWQEVIKSIETAINSIQDALAAAGIAIAAAAAAEASAVVAQAAADGANSVASLTNSGVTPNPLSATDAGADATITIAAHTRVYGDGSTLAIAGPTNLTGLAYSTLYFVYYDDPTRADTTPSYQTTTSEATAAQTGDRHLVGMVLTPAAAAPDNNGDHVRPPGVGGILP